MTYKERRPIIYQLLPRLYGNRNRFPLPNGSIAENGCGHMSDLSRTRLRRIRSLGVTHIWFTGLIAHASTTDYSAIGISPQNPAVVKGKAGSPYAIRDYYDIDPDLSQNPANRFDDFKALLGRTHAEDMGFIMDFVPNHVARQYHSNARPDGVRDLGEDDDDTRAFDAQNNFYYLPYESFHCPKGDAYKEQPAKVTGNDCFTASPSEKDWYETVKLNYGVDYLGGRTSHFQPIPNTWLKMRDILLFWASQGVDGFRCDMAEMVPVEFWAWAIRQVKAAHPDIIFIAEVYNPAQYRDYINKGGFDYLYDKVGLYDTLRAVMNGQRPATAITQCWQQVDDIQDHMLRFLENHDEQRLASDFFAGEGAHGVAALVVAAGMGRSPFMVYMGQEIGERGMDSEGFSGRDGRTSIFDYWTVRSLYNWLYYPNLVTNEEKELYRVYRKVLSYCNSEAALRCGDFYDLMYANTTHPATFDAMHQYAFMRLANGELIVCLANFLERTVAAEVTIPAHAFAWGHITPGKYDARDLVSGRYQVVSLLPDATVTLRAAPWSGCMLKIKFPTGNKDVANN